MKGIISILLIFSFLVQSTSQLWIKSLFYLNRNYIAENLCINRFEAVALCKGSCYLEDRLQQNQEKQEQKHADLKLEQTLLFAPDGTITNRHPLYYSSTKKRVALRNLNFTPQEYVLSIFHPPDILI